MEYKKLDNGKGRVTFHITKEEFEHGLEHAYEHIAGDVKIKGFRQGHVPRSVFEQHYGVEALYEDAMNHILGHKFEEVYDNPEIEIATSPKLVDFKYEDINPQTGFDCSLEFYLMPVAKLGMYEGIEVDGIDTSVSEEEIENEFRSYFSDKETLEVKEGNLEKGDTAVFDFEGFLNGEPFQGGKAENYSIVIGSGQFIPGFEDGMLGMNTGEKRDINLTFPQKYHEHLAGKDVVFKVLLHEIKKTVKLEITDEDVAKLEHDQKTVAEFKKYLENKLIETKTISEKERFESSIMEKICANAIVDIPEEMILIHRDRMRDQIIKQAKQYKMELEDFLKAMGIENEKFEADIRKNARMQILTSLVIDAIIIDKNFVATDEEIEKYYQEFAEIHHRDIAEVKEYISYLDAKHAVCDRKALDYVVSKAISK